MLVLSIVKGGGERERGVAVGELLSRSPSALLILQGGDQATVPGAHFQPDGFHINSLALLKTWAPNWFFNP